MYRWEKWPRCLTRPGSEMRRNFIVRDFVQFSKGGPHHSLILGTLYLRWVSHSCVRSRLIHAKANSHIPVDVGPFCDAVERLCGLYNLHTDNQQFKLNGSELTPVYAATFITRM